MTPRVVRGFVFKNRSNRDKWLVVYLSRQELRLQCGEVKEKDIEEVEVRRIK
mgnify:CR=1 FL=1